MAPEPPPYVHEPDLEEAAIRFANGDYAGAEAGLLEALARHENDEDLARQAEFWMALFDFYRATGDQARFEALAIDFAARFGRSAPLWFSMPELLGLQPPSAAAADEPAGGAPREFLWNAPSVLTAQSVAALQASVARASAPPWTFSWSRLMTIEEGAVPGLAQQFEQWADRTEAIVFKGVDALASLLEARTPSGDRSVPPDWWRLRMAALRLMGRPDEFELVALDYCVTYEVSPPSWAPPACSYCDDGGGAGELRTPPSLSTRMPSPRASASRPPSRAAWSLPWRPPCCPGTSRAMRRPCSNPWRRTCTPACPSPSAATASCGWISPPQGPC